MVQLYEDGLDLQNQADLLPGMISPSISREIYPRTKYYTDNSSYTRVTPSGKKLYQKQVEFSKFGRNMTEQW